MGWLKISVLFAFALNLTISCHKQYKSKVTGKLLHPNGSPVGNQGLVIKGDNYFGKDNAVEITDATGRHTTDHNGDFSLLVKTPRGGKCYINAVQKDGSLMRIGEMFYLKEGETVDVGIIMVSW